VYVSVRKYQCKVAKSHCSTVSAPRLTSQKVARVKIAWEKWSASWALCSPHVTHASHTPISSSPWASALDRYTISALRSRSRLDLCPQERKKELSSASSVSFSIISIIQHHQYHSASSVSFSIISIIIVVSTAAAAAAASGVRVLFAETACGTGSSWRAEGESTVVTGESAAWLCWSQEYSVMWWGKSSHPAAAAWFSWYFSGWVVSQRT